MDGAGEARRLSVVAEEEEEAVPSSSRFNWVTKRAIPTAEMATTSMEMTINAGLDGIQPRRGSLLSG